MDYINASAVVDLLFHCFFLYLLRKDLPQEWKHKWQEVSRFSADGKSILPTRRGEKKTWQFRKLLNPQQKQQLATITHRNKLTETLCWLLICSIYHRCVFKIHGWKLLLIAIKHTFVSSLKLLTVKYSADYNARLTSIATRFSMGFCFSAIAPLHTFCSYSSTKIHTLTQVNTNFFCFEVRA